MHQVEFDSAYYEEEQRLETSAASKERRLKEMVRRVIQNKPKHGGCYACTSECMLYVCMYTILLVSVGGGGLNRETLLVYRRDCVTPLTHSRACVYGV